MSNVLITITMCVCFCTANSTHYNITHTIGIHAGSITDIMQGSRGPYNGIQELE